MNANTIKKILIFIGVILMLNSSAVWAFSLFSYGQLSLIYLVNGLPIFVLFLLMQRQSRQKVNKSGFVFLFMILIKMIWILSFLFFFDKKVGISKVFLGNFLIVYFIFLFLGVFIGIRFLFDKNKE